MERFTSRNRNNRLRKGIFLQYRYEVRLIDLRLWVGTVAWVVVVIKVELCLLARLPETSAEANNKQEQVLQGRDVMEYLLPALFTSSAWPFAH